MLQNSASSSTTLKSVWLHKWWVKKADKGGLAVAGFVSGKSKVARVFCSAAIAKRHDRTTLETSDGFLITISDSIDRFHSLENGFSPEVCNQFLFGFPYNWEDVAKCNCVGESVTEPAGPKLPRLVNETADGCNVWLHKWWLKKADKGGLAVAGLVSGKSKAARVFCSAAIAKRHDRTTLETTDGFLITISDSIDRFHSLENGFSPEVCNQFLFGFPYNWEDVAKCNCGESLTEPAGPKTPPLVNETTDGCNILSPVSLDDLPATKIRDFILSPNHLVRKRLLDDALGRWNDQSTEISSSTKSESSVTDSSPFSQRTPVNEKVWQTLAGDVMYNSNIIEGCTSSTQFKMNISVPATRGGIVTGQSTTVIESNPNLQNKAPVTSTKNHALAPRRHVARRRSTKLIKTVI